MKQFEKLIEDNYKSIVDRGLINEKTTINDFVFKLEEEVGELTKEAYNPISGDFKMELADVMLVCLNIAHHYDIDIVNAMNKKVIINQNRTD